MFNSSDENKQRISQSKQEEQKALRVCSKCKKELVEKDNFHKNGKGYYSRCKICKKSKKRKAISFTCGTCHETKENKYFPEHTRNNNKIAHICLDCSRNLHERLNITEITLRYKKRA